MRSRLDCLTLQAELETGTVLHDLWLVNHAQIITVTLVIYFRAALNFPPLAS